ncbi:MAG: methyltransferase domain-containing protein [Chitinophagaceae bacterium]
MLLQSPFDVLADTYDSVFTDSLIGRMQRQRVWKQLSGLLRLYDRPLDILEINCGTGEDALQLARLGHRVTATDASAKMIERARLKAGSAGCDHKQLQFITCPFSQLGPQFHEQKFDLVLSNFGGLNCVSARELFQLSSALSSLLVTSGRLFLVLMGDFCLWEMGYFALRAKFKMAFRRQQHQPVYRANGHDMPVFYHSPKKLKKCLYPLFSITAISPVGLFIPPSYLEKWFSRHRNWLNKLNKWENNWGYPVFSSLADHYCIIFNKNELFK